MVQNAGTIVSSMPFSECRWRLRAGKVRWYGEATVKLKLLLILKAESSEEEEKNNENEPSPACS